MTEHFTAHIQAIFNCENGRTRAAHLSCAAPLKIARTWARAADGGLDLCLMDASPGMLAGDRYALDFHLSRGARVAVTTQGFARIHPSASAPCALKTRLQIAEDAILEWHPEPLMLYKDADLRAQTTVELARGATLIASEVWCAGRTGRGEVWQFARFDNRWNVRQNGAPIFASALDLTPRDFDPRAKGAWNNCTHSGSFWAWGALSNQTLLEDFWQIIENQSAVYAGATLVQGGAMVSMLGARAHDLTEMIGRLRGLTNAPELRSSSGK